MPKRSAHGRSQPADAGGDAGPAEEQFPETMIVDEDSADDSQDLASQSESGEEALGTGLTGLDAIIAAARARHQSSAVLATESGKSDGNASNDEANIQMSDSAALPAPHALRDGSPAQPELLAQGAEDGPADQPHDGPRLPRRVPQSSLLRDEAFLADEGSDSSEDERPSRNTVGNVPLEWYKHEEHIGYDRDGEPIKRKGKPGDMLDTLLARNDTPGAALRTIYDPYNDEELTLSRAELRMLLNIQQGKTPDVEVDPYADHVDWYSNTVDDFTGNNAPIPKRRFRPSVWEEQKIVKLVRAMRRGWIKPREQQAEVEAPPVYLMWGEDGNVGSHKTGAGLTRIPAPKPDLPTNEESYNPPAEYLPTEEERAAHAALPEEDRKGPLPQAFGSLREVPQYGKIVHERFERCLDLYLCPRVRSKRRDFKADDLVPKAMPKPSELRPFPNKLCITYQGHRGKVRCLSPDPTGQWLLTGSDDGSMRLWEVLTGRCCREWPLGGRVASVGWCPDCAMRVAAAAVGSRLVLVDTGVGPPAAAEAAAAALTPPEVDPEAGPVVTRWVRGDHGGLDICHNHQIRSVHWHGRGDYFVSACPGGASQSVVVHQLSRRSSQAPFRKSKGKVTGCQFHPTKPLLLVAGETNVRVYNLVKQGLTKTLLAGGGVIAAMHVHPSGDHVLVGTEDCRCLWFDLDLSSKPYKVMKYHTAVVRGVNFHARYPLFASGSDDGSLQVFHGMVFSDLLTNPLIVPVKTLTLHAVTDFNGVMAVAFHPHQPWVFSGGGDGLACLSMDV
eukprot:jgi/Ulvmu1/465/UM001_0472.1